MNGRDRCCTDLVTGTSNWLKSRQFFNLSREIHRSKIPIHPSNQITIHPESIQSIPIQSNPSGHRSNPPIPPSTHRVPPSEKTNQSKTTICPKSVCGYSSGGFSPSLDGGNTVVPASSIIRASVLTGFRSIIRSASRIAL